MVLKITNLHILRYLPTCWLYLLERYAIDNQRCTHAASTSVLTLNAVEPVKITNEEVENGRVSAKVVYEQEGTFLTPEYRFEFRYNDKGQIIEKKSMKWNGTTWINYYCMEVTYTDTEAHIDYSLWNKNKKAFIPTQKYVYTLDEAGKFLAWHSYKKDATGWELDGLINNEVLLAKR